MKLKSRRLSFLKALASLFLILGFSSQILSDFVAADVRRLWNSSEDK
jgi:hypothetical protein